MFYDGVLVLWFLVYKAGDKTSTSLFSVLD